MKNNSQRIQKPSTSLHQPKKDSDQVESRIKQGSNNANSSPENNHNTMINKSESSNQNIISIKIPSMPSRYLKGKSYSITTINKLTANKGEDRINSDYRVQAMHNEEVKYRLGDTKDILELTQNCGDQDALDKSCELSPSKARKANEEEVEFERYDKNQILSRKSVHNLRRGGTGTSASFLSSQQKNISTIRTRINHSNVVLKRTFNRELFHSTPSNLRSSEYILNNFKTILNPHFFSNKLQEIEVGEQKKNSLTPKPLKCQIQILEMSPKMRRSTSHKALSSKHINGALEDPINQDFNSIKLKHLLTKDPLKSLKAQSQNYLFEHKTDIYREVKPQSSIEKLKKRNPTFLEINSLQISNYNPYSINKVPNCKNVQKFTSWSDIRSKPSYLE